MNSKHLNFDFDSFMNLLSEIKTTLLVISLILFISVIFISSWGLYKIINRNKFNLASNKVGSCSYQSRIDTTGKNNYANISKLHKTSKNMRVSKIGSLVNKSDYDCDECCCGGCCSCCTGHLVVNPINYEPLYTPVAPEVKDEDKDGPAVSDVPLAWGLYFQDGASPSFEGIVELHNRIMFYLIVILFGVSWVISSLIIHFNKSENKLVYRHLNHGTLIELIWTVGPALILVAIAFPSFKLLYLMDEVIDPAMTVKVTGHQWYWEYEYADFLNEENETINFDSYMKDEGSLELGELRMLDVDNSVVVPVDTHIRFIITGADVIHDWAVPSLGIKVDAAPGRLNQASVIIERTGFFYGQCSEICLWPDRLFSSGKVTDIP